MTDPSGSPDAARDAAPAREDPMALDTLGPMPSRVLPWKLRERLARFDPPPARSAPDRGDLER